MDKNHFDKDISKLLSYVLRHNPSHFHLEISEDGWVDVVQILRGFEEKNISLQDEDLARIVRENNKQRFAFSNDGLIIRANQGDSIPVNLNLKPIEPPEFLYHGTSITNLESIQETGIQRMNRHHVHLSENFQTAFAVGSRHGIPVVLQVFSQKMYSEGKVFFQSKNKVWLTEFVSSEYFQVLT